jgi:hypothetical protein
MIATHRDFLARNGQSSTIRRYLAALSHAFTMAVKEGRLTGDNWFFSLSNHKINWAVCGFEALTKGHSSWPHARRERGLKQCQKLPSRPLIPKNLQAQAFILSGLSRWRG